MDGNVWDVDLTSEVAAPPAWILRTLETHQREAEHWLAQHNAKLRSTFQRACWASSQSQASFQPSQDTRRDSFDLPTVGKMPQTVFSELQSAASRLPDLRNPEETLHLRVMNEYTTRSAKSHFLQVITDNEHVTSPFRGVRARLDLMLQGCFDAFIGFLIVLNAVVMFVELEVEGSRDPLETKSSKLIFMVFRHAFNGLFFSELVLKLFVYRWQFWRSFFNQLDAVIVLVSMVDTYILSFMASEFFNVSVVRLVRFARLVRVLRVIRTLSLFRQLRVLLNTIAMSFMSLVWSMVVLFVVMLTVSLLLCQMVQDYLGDNSGNSETREQLQHYYGTSSRSLYSIFELTFSGCWPNYARILIDDVSVGYTAFFALYVTGVIFAMVRIISALFLKDTLQAASNDADIIVSEKLKEIKSFVSKLSDLFHEADINGDGFLTMEELQKVLSFPKVRLWMNVVGLDVSDATGIFTILDDGDGRVTQEEFVNGVMRLKGYARSQDTVLILRDCERITQQCKAMRVICESLYKLIRNQLASAEPPDKKLRVVERI